MSIQHQENCPLCGSQSIHQQFTCTDRYATGEVFEVYRCASCHFLFTQDAPAETNIGRYYQTAGYISHTDTRQGLMNRVYHYMRAYMLGRKVRLLARHVPQKGHALDIGTGTGYFPATLREKGWTVQAVEQSAEARAFAQSHFGLSVDAPECLWEYEAQAFDAITLWHVMEHLHQLDKTWVTLHRILKDGGRLVVAVPNAASYDAQRYGTRWAAYDVPRHLWHFTPNTLMRWAEKYGFTLEAQYPMPLDAFYVSMLTEKQEGSAFSFVKGLFVGLKAWFASLRQMECSSSIIYVLKKRNRS